MWLRLWCKHNIGNDSFHSYCYCLPPLLLLHLPLPPPPPPEPASLPSSLPPLSLRRPLRLLSPPRRRRLRRPSLRRLRSRPRLRLPHPSPPPPPEFEPKASSYPIRPALHVVVAYFQISVSPEARYFASLAPLLNALRLLVNGLSLVSDEGLVKSVTRQGNPEELLKGPLYYVLILIICAVFFWRDSPVGVISLAMMCGGDGVADIMGRRFGSKKIPYNPQKSWAGSISMFVFGFLISMGMLYYFSSLGYFQLDWIETMQKVALVSFVATLVESVSSPQVIDDNISVPLVSMVVASMCFNY